MAVRPSTSPVVVSTESDLKHRGRWAFSQQVLPQRRQRFRPLTLRCRAAGGQQNIGVLIGKAAVIQRTLRADKLQNIPVRRQAALAVIQVEAAVLQPLEVRLQGTLSTVTVRPQRLSAAAIS